MPITQQKPTMSLQGSKLDIAHLTRRNVSLTIFSGEMFSIIEVNVDKGVPLGLFVIHTLDPFAPDFTHVQLRIKLI